MRCHVALSLLTFLSAAPLLGQTPAARPAPSSTPAVAPSAPAPTWETQKQARTYFLGIPAPRGQIVDRNGLPLAQSRVSHNLAIGFPTPLNFSERDVLNFTKDQVVRAQLILGRQIPVSMEGALKHYKNRGVVPFVIAQDLRPAELDLIKRARNESLVLQPVYQRFYPNGQMAGHIIGYAGRTGKTPDGPIENNELLWPDSEGREGLEQTFNDQLQGKLGQYNISFDAAGKKASERVAIPPQAGYNVVTTLDARIQRLCEESLARSCRRGAIVILDPNNGDILAMASWPSLNPNAFVPRISDEAYKALNDDKDIPLYPRAFRASYPPGSTFKVFVGMAALQSGKVKIDDEYDCPAALEIGNLTFRNWKKRGSGSLNFADALTQSCNTWFYQVGMKIGSRLIGDYAQRVGLGLKTGIPLNAETEGRIPTDEYMLKNYKRRLLNGDVANLSIGQGDTLVSPLQMAQAMGVVGNGGTFYQTRLVKQVQSIDDQVVTAYDVRVRGQVEVDKEVLAEVHRAMVQVVESGAGTAHKAQVSGVHVAGKTGTAQWGPKTNERTAAWFAGFAPKEKPKYAFAALYESDSAGADVHGGTVAAPLIGRVLREVFKEAPKESKTKGRKRRKAVVEEAEELPVRRAQPAVGPE